MMRPLDTWLKARRDFVEGKAFLAGIADKYGIPEGTVRTRSKREKWGKARNAFIARKIELPLVELPAIPLPPPTDTDKLGQKVHRLEMQIERIDGMIDSESDPETLVKLATAKARFLEIWRIFTNVPMPGTRRPPKETNRRLQQNLGPIEPEAAAA